MENYDFPLYSLLYLAIHSTDTFFLMGFIIQSLDFHFRNYQANTSESDDLVVETDRENRKGKSIFTIYDTTIVKGTLNVF